jgi:hypothetical protein
MEAALAARTRICAKPMTEGDSVAKVVPFQSGAAAWALQLQRCAIVHGLPFAGSRFTGHREQHNPVAKLLQPRAWLFSQCIIDKQNRTC